MAIYSFIIWTPIQVQIEAGSPESLFVLSKEDSMKARRQPKAVGRFEDKMNEKTTIDVMTPTRPTQKQGTLVEVLTIVGGATERMVNDIVSYVPGMSVESLTSSSSRTITSGPVEEILAKSNTAGIYDLVAPDDYPSISESAREGALQIVENIFSNFQSSPASVDPSVEGGVALVYRKKNGWFFQKKSKELFIEVYNKDSIVIAVIDNSSLIDVKETTSDDETTINQSFETFSFKKTPKAIGGRDTREVAHHGIQSHR